MSRSIVIRCLFATALTLSAAAPVTAQGSDLKRQMAVYDAMEEVHGHFRPIVDQTLAGEFARAGDSLAFAVSRFQKVHEEDNLTGRLFGVRDPEARSLLSDMARAQVSLIGYLSGKLLMFAGSPGDATTDDHRLAELLEAYEAAREEFEAHLGSTAEGADALDTNRNRATRDRVIQIEPQLSQEEQERKRERYQEFLREQERQHLRELRIEQRRVEEQKRRLAEQRKRESVSQPNVQLTPEQMQKALEGAVDPVVKKKMVDWHEGYKYEIRPVKTALSRFAPLRQSRSRPPNVTAACQDMWTAAEDAQNADYLTSPDPKIGEALERMRSNLIKTAESCLLYDMKQSRVHFSAAEKALQEAAKALAPYGLQL